MASFANRSRDAPPDAVATDGAESPEPVVEAEKPEPRVRPVVYRTLVSAPGASFGITPERAHGHLDLPDAVNTDAERVPRAGDEGEGWFELDEDPLVESDAFDADEPVFPGLFDDEGDPDHLKSSTAEQDRVSRSRFLRILERFTQGSIPALTVVAAMLLFCMVFSYAHIQNHRAFATYSFDTGIYDQAVWTLAHDRRAFITVRGLYVFGHHVNLILYLLVPVSLLGGGASAFLVIQTLVLAAGAWPIFLIARQLFDQPAPPPKARKLTRLGRFGKLGKRGQSATAQVGKGVARTGSSKDRFGPMCAAGLSIAYLLSPVVQWVNQAHWHPEAFSGTALLWAWWFALNKRWKGFSLAVLFALATREETALTVAFMGLVLLVNNRDSLRGFTKNRDDRRRVLPGVLTIAVSVSWFLIATKLIIPAFNDGRPPYFYATFFETFGGSATGVIRTVLTDPRLVFTTLTDPSRTRYLRDLGLPTLFAFVLSPVHCLMMVPTLAANLLTDNQYAREIRYQYASVLIGPMWIATVHGVTRFGRRKSYRRSVAVMVLLAALVTNVKFSPSPLSSGADTAWWRPTEVSRVQQAAVEMVPKSAGVSATYFMLTHLDQRRHIYDWPNPFQPTYWGNYDPVNPTPPPDPSNVSWIVVDRATMDEAGLELLDLLTAPGGRFEVYFDEADVVVAGPVRTKLRHVDPTQGTTR